MTPTAPSAALPVSRLIEAFNKLPGIGPKSAQRLTYYLLRAPQEEAQALAQAILEMKEKIILCSVCQNITDADPCAICDDDQRDRTKICVVEEPLDILALGADGQLQGALPRAARRHLADGRHRAGRAQGARAAGATEVAGEVQEVIMATNPNLEGEATAMYLTRLIAPLGIRVTRLARGLPVGADLEYADDVTLTRALEGRQEV